MTPQLRTYNDLSGCHPVSAHHLAKFDTYDDSECFSGFGITAAWVPLGSMTCRSTVYRQIITSSFVILIFSRSIVAWRHVISLAGIGWLVPNDSKKTQCQHF